MSTSSKILVIGAINLDLSAVPSGAYITGDSNIVDITYGVGGVGTNIASNLAVLGHSVTMITTLGVGPFYHHIEAELSRRHVDLRHAIRHDEVAPNFYLSILDHNHDLHLGLNDMKGIESLSVEDILARADVIQSHPIVIVDCNVAPDILNEVANLTQDHMLVVDAVSATKVHKVMGILDNIDVLKMNRIEYDTLLANGFDPHNHPDLITIVTDHDLPVTVYHHNQIMSIPTKPIPVIASTTGAGDALLSGVVHALSESNTIRQAVDVGITLAGRVMALSGSCLTKEI